MDTVRVLEKSHKTIKDYWRSNDILKGIKINTAWEKVSEKCWNGDWHKCFPQFMHNFTGFWPVENTVADISSIAQEAGLDEFRAEDITQLLDSQGQQHSNEDFKDMVKELSQQEEEEKKKKKSLP
jgi:hypothetical protein